MAEEILLIKRCIAELIGTAVLVFLGTGAVVSASLFLKGASFDMPTWLVVGLAFGLTITIMIYIFGLVSGTNINPAVTIALWATRKLPTRDAVAYILVQLIGAALGSLLVVLLWGSRSVGTGLGATTMGADVSYWQAIVVEAIGTFLLVLAIMATAVDRRAPQGWAGLIIGLTATIAIVVTGGLTGGSLNPARTFGPYVASTLAGGSNFWSQFPIYVVGPVLGGLLAAFLYDYLAGLSQQPVEGEKEHHKKHV